MPEPSLRDLATEYLLPFFSGAWIEDREYSSSPRDQLVAYRTPCSVLIKLNRSDRHRIAVTRSQPFVKRSTNIVPETDVMKAFVKTISAMSSFMKTEFKDDILSTLQRRIVAKSIFAGKWQESYLNGIDILNNWGEKLYEGAPISAAIGYRSMQNQEFSTTIEELSRESFGCVLSNGHDTILEFDYSGGFVGLKSLQASAAVPSYCPFRQSAIGEWTTAHEARVAMSLNRLGEILIFRDHKLLFARRAGKWHFLTHDPVIKQMNVPRDPALRRAIYETCLDSSFARTGGCVGVIQQDASRRWTSLIHEGDFVDTSPTAKGKALRKIITKRKFHELDRRVRQELAAIDGAVVLAHDGGIIAAGAILQIGAGSSGGGRLAAAKALGEYGLGVKISQDGSISGFRPGKSEAAFKVM